MTERLYYDDSYITEFTAHVVDSITVGEKTAVLLDRTCFYPTSGGQQHDIGTLNGIEVVDVQATDQGDVRHVLADPLSDGKVTGRIDWMRRFDHMQHHTGQHLLSQAFRQVLGIESVSVHFGDYFCTVDVEADELSAAQLVAVEEQANQIIWEDRPVRTYWVNEDTISSVPLRLPPKVSGDIRIVEIEKYDWTACGGTHVARTGEIGPIALLKTERIRQETRVTFLCGRRALRDYRTRRRLLYEASNLLDTAEEEVPSLVAKTQHRLKETARQVREMQETLLDYRAQDLVASARSVGDIRLVSGIFSDLDPAALKGLALALKEQDGLVALLFCPSGGKGTAIFTRSDGLSVDVAQVLREVLARYKGGGGGSPELAQGGGMPADALADVLESATELVEEELAGR